MLAIRWILFRCVWFVQCCGKLSRKWTTKIKVTVLAFLVVERAVECLICYDCGQTAVTPTRLCNATSTCPQAQRCLLKSLVSSLDGHKAYEMRCGNIEECDGTEIVPVGKRLTFTRSLTLDCCTTDLCNIPAHAGNLVPTTPGATCNRDIEMMLEDSTSVSAGDHGLLVQFIKSMVSKMAIGAQANQIGLSTYDTNIDHEWDLDKYLTQAELHAALDQLTFSHRPKDSADIHRVVDFLTDHALRHINGDRSMVPDSVIIFLDQNTHVRLRDSILNEQHKLSSITRDVVLVVIGAGKDSPEVTQLYQLASSSGHVLHVPSYSNLSGLEQQLIALLCK